MPHAESALDALGRNLIGGFDPPNCVNATLVGEVEKRASYNLKAFFPESSAVETYVRTSGITLSRLEGTVFPLNSA